MALIKCTECNREISDKAVSCPGCGYPIQVTDDSVLNSKPKPVDVMSNKIGLEGATHDGVCTDTGNESNERKQVLITSYKPLVILISVGLLAVMYFAYINYYNNKIILESIIVPDISGSYYYIPIKVVSTSYNDNKCRVTYMASEHLKYEDTTKYYAEYLANPKDLTKSLLGTPTNNSDGKTKKDKYTGPVKQMTANVYISRNIFGVLTNASSE